MYAHFGHGFFTSNGQLQPRFVHLMTRLARKNGCFVTVGTLLNFIKEQRGITVLSPTERARLEWPWLLSKLRHGTS